MMAPISGSLTVAPQRAQKVSSSWTSHEQLAQLAMTSARRGAASCCLAPRRLNRGGLRRRPQRRHHLPLVVEHAAGDPLDIGGAHARQILRVAPVREVAL